MYKLIIADDEYEIRTGLANYFPWNSIGFEVVFTAKNGREALDYILKNDVDVLISDIKMPGMSGIELAKEIYNMNINLKVIFLSGYKDFEYAQNAINYGVKKYIIKPTKYNEIIDTFTKIKSELDKEEASKPMLTKQENGQVESIEDSKSDNDKIICYIKSYVNYKYKNVTLEDVAKKVYLNPDYLSKFFKQKTGQNFSDYVTSVRMKKASELLKELCYKTYEISEMVGYSNQHNFTRAFKKYYGISPSEYRHLQNKNL